MTTKLPAVDIVIVGLGWAGGIIAKELAATGLKIVALERGGPRDTKPELMEPAKDAEIRFSRRYELMQDVSRETLTFRNNTSQTALPMRRLGSFLPGEGVGGAGVHWGGMTWRFMEWDHEARSRTIAKYGAKIIPEDMYLQDWALNYTELEPYYEKFERLCGTSGKAGNLAGRKVDGGNVFEGPRKSEYPLSPMNQSYSAVLFDGAARNLGYHPFPIPTSTASEAYVNPDGVAYGRCHSCGFCEGYGCEVNAKASPHFTVIPLAAKAQNVEIRTRSRVLKVNLDSARKKAVSVTYLDARGREIEQPAALIVLSAYALWNVHMMLLSGIGKPYDPVSGKGVVGRSYSYQAINAAQLTFGDDVHLNPFMGSGGSGSCIDDFNGDGHNFGEVGFIGGGGILVATTGARPIGFHPVRPGTPRWGSAWKKAVIESYNRTAFIGNQGSVMSYRQNYLDLDPTYKDAFGRPLLRMTYDHQPNEINQMKRQADVLAQIGHAMGAVHVDAFAPQSPYSIVPYQSTHNVGGAVSGHDPSTSALNKYLQSWDVPNVFVVGAQAFPQNAGKNPTGPLGALSYWAAEAIRDKYLKNPGRLVHA